LSKVLYKRDDNKNKIKVIDTNQFFFFSHIIVEYLLKRKPETYMGTNKIILFRISLGQITYTTQRGITKKAMEAGTNKNILKFIPCSILSKQRYKREKT
jgi:hypothetical protein